MELLQIERPSNWNQEIENFDSKTLFHESVWLDFIQASRPDLELEYFRILDSGSTVGYFCAFKKRKAMLRIYGSPFAGTGIGMGPIVSRTVDSRSLVEALLHLCRSQGGSYLEMRNPFLEPQIMKSLGFTAVTGAAQICPLPASESEPLAGDVQQLPAADTPFREFAIGGRTQHRSRCCEVVLRPLRPIAAEQTPHAGVF